MRCTTTTKNHQTFSINAAADLLERDRRTIGRALKGILPDALENGQPRYRLRSIIDALDVKHRRIYKLWLAEEDIDAFDQELIQTAKELHIGLMRLRAEPDIKRRREMAYEVGPGVGKLCDAFDIILEVLPPEIRPLAKLVANRCIGDAIEDILSLCQWNFDPSA